MDGSHSFGISRLLQLLTEFSLFLSTPTPKDQSQLVTKLLDYFSPNNWPTTNGPIGDYSTTTLRGWSSPIFVEIK
jgi:hypothetical protein